MNCEEMFKKGSRLSILVIAAGVFLFVFSATAQPLLPVQWQKSFGGTNDDFLVDIKPTGDGGYLLAGGSKSDRSGNKTSPLRGEHDIFVVKIGPDGKRQWDRSVGNGVVGMSALVTTADGGFVVGSPAYTGTAQTKSDPGYGSTDYWLIKFDYLGRKQWDQTYGGTDHDALRSVARTADGGYLLGGTSWSGLSGNRSVTNRSLGARISPGDSWIVKTDALGRKEWDRAHRYAGALIAAQPLSDGGYLIGKAFFTFEKVDAAGNTEWQRSFAPADSASLSVFRPTPDGGFIAAGALRVPTTSTNGGLDFLLVKVNANWEVEWNAVYGGTLNEHMDDVQLTRDGGYIVGGNTYSADDHQSRVRIIKFDANGARQWERSFTGGKFDNLTSVRQTKDGGYILGAYSDSPTARTKTAKQIGGFDFWVVKLGKPASP